MEHASYTMTDRLAVMQERATANTMAVTTIIRACCRNPCLRD